MTGGSDIEKAVNELIKPKHTIPIPGIQSAMLAAARAIEEDVYGMCGIKPNGILTVNLVLQAFERHGHCVINKRLTVEQRNAASNALVQHKFEIQPLFDAILERMPKCP